MFSMKITASQLKAIRETDLMIAEVARWTQEDLSPLLDASVSGKLINAVSGPNRRTLKTSGSVAAGRRLLRAKSIIELLKEGDLWVPVRGNLLLDTEHYTFEYTGNRSYMKRSYQNLFPSLSGF